MKKIGRLENVSPREAWKHEAHDFTPWLSENLDQLGEAIGLKIEAEGTEVAVGPFSADILAKDFTGRMVLIENQLGSSDHTHLGQILTYLTGLDAEIVVWVATEFRDEHLSAINWLNENTGEQFCFFAVRLRVVRIDDSFPAPIFDVLARPNEWERTIQKRVREATGELSPLAAERREFWEYYLEQYPQDSELGVQLSGTSNNWLSTSGEVGMFVSIYKAKTEIGVFLRGQRGVPPSEIQQRLAPHAKEFEQIVGNCNNLGSTTHHPSDSLKLDTLNKENWKKATDWLHERAHAFLSAANVVEKLP